MKKFVATMVAAILVVLGVGALLGQASATGGDHNKKVTFCHATGSETNPFVKITTSVNAFYNAGHVNHADDIWEAFSYTNNRGDVVNVPAQGDTSLLAFEDCNKPVQKEKIAKPEPIFLDPCGTEDDVFSVAPGRGYTVSGVVMEGNNQVITVTLEPNFTWTDGSVTPLRIIKPAFTDVDCDLPDTGVGAQYATTAGWGALGGVVVLMSGMLLIQKRRKRTNS